MGGVRWFYGCVDELGGGEGGGSAMTRVDKE